MAGRRDGTTGRFAAGAGAVARALDPRRAGARLMAGLEALADRADPGGARGAYPSFRDR